MKTIWNQMLGREPEPMWMTVLGLVCIVCIVTAGYLYAVAMGVR